MTTCCCTRESTAVHEAGHTVAAWALGLEVGVVWATEQSGRTILSRLSSLPSPFEDVVWLVAGPSAEEIAFGAACEEGTRKDRVCAERSGWEVVFTLDDVGTALDAVDGLLARARAFIVDEVLRPRWPLVREVAERLLAHGALREELADLPRPPALDASLLRGFLLPLEGADGGRGSVGFHADSRPPVSVGAV